MDRLRRLGSLSSGERLLLLQAVFWVTLIRLGLWLVPFDRLRRLPSSLEKSRKGVPPHALDPERMVWAVRVVGQYIPRASCLTQALALQVLLAQRGHRSNLRIGVALRDERDLAAHAWVEFQGRVLIGATETETLKPLPGFDEQPI